MPCRKTDGHTDMTKLIVALCNFVNAPVNWRGERERERERERESASVNYWSVKFSETLTGKSLHSSSCTGKSRFLRFRFNVT